jgi:thiamine transporter
MDIKKKDRITSLVEVGIFVSIALVLDLIFGYIPFLNLPYGGNISVAMLPIFVVSFRRGWRNGLVAGLAFGLVQYLFKPYWLSLPQFAMDYLVAFAVLGLAGIFRHALTNAWSLTLGILLGSFLRFLAASIAGLLFWAEYIPTEIGFLNGLFGTGMPEAGVTAGAFLYNAIYMIPSALLCILVGIALQKRKILALNLDRRDEHLKKM